MPSSTVKKVNVTLFGHQPVEGYVMLDQYLRREGVDMMDKNADARTIPYSHVKAVRFIRKFGCEPDKRQRNLFLTRPKLGGLWVRMQFKDGEELEGVIRNDLTVFDNYGVTMIPPDSKGNTQKVFVPREALQTFVVMGVIGRPHKVGRPRKPPTVPSGPGTLFPDRLAGAAGAR